MANVNTVLIKTVRVTGWLLLPLIVLYLVSGYVWGARVEEPSWMRLETAAKLHSNMDIPLIILLIGHIVPSVYLAVGRWTRKRTNNP
jgi:cytochrome b subunit of formate dehydrogenase